MTIDLNVKPKTIRLLEKNKGINLYDLGLGNGFSDMTPKIQLTKEEIDKFDFIKLKVCVLREGTVMLGYIKNLCNSTIKRQVFQFKNGKKFE